MRTHSRKSANRYAGAGMGIRCNAMTDLIERLREYAKPGTGTFRPTSLLEEAADEIERLRFALEQIKDEVAGNFDACAYNIAKDALDKDEL